MLMTLVKASFLTTIEGAEKTDGRMALSHPLYLSLWDRGKINSRRELDQELTSSRTD